MVFRFIKYSFLIGLMLFILGCGKNKTEEVADAIRTGITFLNDKQCQQAIDVLQSIEMQPRNARYMKALASAYACRAGYSTTKFFADDVAKTATPAPMGGMTTYSTSLVPVISQLSEDSRFLDLSTAITLLQYAGGVSLALEPSSEERAKYFSGRDAGDINAQLVFMMLVQAGKFMSYYANTSAAGVKGGGGETNKCFTDYSAAPSDVQDYVTNILPGACNVVNDPHSELAIGANDRKEKLCYGVTLFNSILDVLPSILVSAGGGDLDSIKDVTTTITASKTVLVDKFPGIGATATTMSLVNCVADTSITEETLSAYYAVVFEGLVK